MATDCIPEAHCFVCGRHTDHFAEHDELVGAGLARYDSETGSVYRTEKYTKEAAQEAIRAAEVLV